jgi:hypothetical protein
MKHGFVFDETMSGTYERVDRPGDRRPLSFSVQARAASLLQHLRDGKAELHGTIEAPGLVDHGPVEGTITIRLFTGRFIRYELRFRGDDGTPYELTGQKDLSVRHPIRSFTELPAEIRNGGGQLVAHADTIFDLSADLLHFVSSWRPA